MSYLRSFLLRLLLVAAVYAVTALVVNPRQTGPVHLLPSSLLDDRLPKNLLFKKFATEGEVGGLVLGSSRTLAISPHTLGEVTGLRYFNFAVSAASITDMANIYEYVLSHGYHPRHIVVGLDVYRLLGRRKVETREAKIARGELIPHLIQELTDLRSIYNVDFAHEMLMALAFGAGLLPPKVLNSFDLAGTLQAHAPAVFAEGQYKGAVSICAASMHSQFTRLDMVSELRFSELNAFLTRASSDGAKVDIFFTPFNPAAEQQIVDGTQYELLQREVIARLSREQSQFHFSIHDLAERAPLRGGAAEWVDCVHFREQYGNMLVRGVFSPERN